MCDFKRQHLVVIIAIAIFFFTMVMYHIKLNRAHYKVSCFNDTIKVSAMSTYNNGDYYYINDGKNICKLSSTDNKSYCLVEETDISGISVLEDFVYYISQEKLFRYNIETEIIELLDEKSGYKYISSDKRYVYAICFINGNYTNYSLMKINDEYKHEFTSEYCDTNEEIITYTDGDSKYLCNNMKYKSFCGVVNQNDKVVFRSNDIKIKNLVYFNNKIIITSDEKGNRLLAYDNDGYLLYIIDIPEGYSYIPQNIYSDDTDIYLLLQAQNGYNAIGYYNLSQIRHKSDAIVKYNVENKNFTFIYETDDKYERIIGYKDDVIIVLHNNNLYSINTNKKEKLTKIGVDNATFEICFDRIFVWGDNKFIGSYSINIQ